MYNDLKKAIVRQRTNLLAIENIIEDMERKGINFDYATDIKVSLNSYGGVIIRVENNYPSLLEVIQLLSASFKAPFTFEMSWSGSYNDIMFSWKNKEGIPIEIWGGFDHDKVPEELTRGCEIQEIEDNRSQYRMVCDV